MASEFEFGRGEIAELLAELGKRLEARGIHASIYVVGGAAIATTFSNDRRLTQDIDAIFEPVGAVRTEVEHMAAERDLPRDWLNSKAAPWIPPPRLDREATVNELAGLTVTTASPRYLLAMKMAAFRPADKIDLLDLFDELGVTDPEQVADIVDDVYGTDAMPNPGRAETILCARSVMADAKRIRASTAGRRPGVQGRDRAGRFASVRRDESPIELAPE